VDSDLRYPDLTSPVLDLLIIREKICQLLVLMLIIICLKHGDVDPLEVEVPCSVHHILVSGYAIKHGFIRRA
jgi:hypothetical protein